MAIKLSKEQLDEILLKAINSVVNNNTEVNETEDTKKTLSKSVIKALQYGDILTVSRIVKISGFSEKQVREELSRLKTSLGSHLILTFSIKGEDNTKYYYLTRKEKTQNTDYLSDKISVTYKHGASRTNVNDVENCSPKFKKRMIKEMKKDVEYLLPDQEIIVEE